KWIISHLLPLLETVATGLTEIFVGWHTAITPKRSEQPPRLLLQCAQTGKPAGYPSLRIYTYTNVPLLRLSIKTVVRSVYPCTVLLGYPRVTQHAGRPKRHLYIQR